MHVGVEPLGLRRLKLGLDPDRQLRLKRLADWFEWGEPACVAAAVAAIREHLELDEPEADEDNRQEARRPAAARVRAVGGPAPREVNRPALRLLSETTRHPVGLR